MHGKTLRNWRAKRAGGRITVSGFDAETNEAVKLVGVDEISPFAITEPKRKLFSSETTQHILEAHAIAVDMHGARHKLLIA